MENLYLIFMLILFTIFFVWDYIKRTKYRKIMDKKGLCNLTLGLILVVVFVTISILDFSGVFNIIEYIFPMWGIAPTIYFIGVIRCLEAYSKNNIKNEKITKNIMLYKKIILELYIYDAVSVCLFMYVVITKFAS